jgi:hypothetical protein
VDVRYVAITVAVFLSSFGIGRWFAAPSPSIVEVAAATPAPATKAEAFEVPEAKGTSASEAADGQPKSVRQPIRDAFAGDDPMASAARIVAWLASATPETFRKLAENPERFPLPRFSGFDVEFRNAYLDAMAARWFELDPEGALPAMVTVEKAQEKGLYNEKLLDAAARLRPELVLKKLPLESKSGYMERYTRAALTSLAVRDAKAALLFTERWKDKGMATSARQAIIAGLAQSDPVKAAALAAEGNDPNAFGDILAEAEKIGPGMVQQVRQIAGDKIGVYTVSADMVLRHPELASDPVVAKSKNLSWVTEDALAEAGYLSAEARERVLADPTEVPEIVRDATIGGIVSAWGRGEPEKALDWVKSHAQPADGKKNEEAVAARNAIAQQVFLRWVNGDEAAALAWWQKLPESALRDAIGTNASTFVAEAGQLELAMQMFHPAKTTDNIVTLQLAQMVSARDPEKAGAWLATLPRENVDMMTAKAVVGDWYARDPEKVASWVETLPAGNARDQAASAFIGEAVQQSATGAAGWVETITDPKLRRISAREVFSRWNQDDSAGARKWLSGLSGVDENWKARTLRRTP